MELEDRHPLSSAMRERVLEELEHIGTTHKDGHETGCY